MKVDKFWGREAIVNNTNWLMCLAIFGATPILVYLFIILAYNHECHISFYNFNPYLALDLYYASKILSIWVGLQIILALIPDYIHQIYPKYIGGVQKGTITPFGSQYSYNINGLQAWIISNILFVSGVYLGLFPLTIIYDNMPSLLVIFGICSYILTVILYIKGYYFGEKDKKITNSRLYDIVMGIELNPRIGNFDLKLFLNGRPGIVAWNLINLSYMGAQYARYGYVTNSMILVNILQGLYIGYFFYQEAWYLKTIDIAHDHMGFMFCFGDLVYLPAMYTLQGLYLVYNPVELLWFYFIFVLGIGLFGFTIFVQTNDQKDEFKRLGTKYIIDGEPVKTIKCSYTTHKGSYHETELLMSGWWGVGRHMNYTGDIILSLAYCMACNIASIYPYFYFFYLTCLLIHRCVRDETKCAAKYGLYWEIYCKLVPYRLIPGVF